VILAMVAGTVVANQKAWSGVYRLVRPCKADGSNDGSPPLVALDAVGSREGDVVLLAQGSSCRWTEQTEGAPVDALVVGIVDAVHRWGVEIYGPGQGERL
jgi:ethanolamine utilization protein EutN